MLPIDKPFEHLPRSRARSTARSFAAIIALLCACACSRMELTTEQACNIGIYRLSDGRLLDIAPSEGKDLRWRLADGRTGRLRADRGGLSTLGWTDEPDSIGVALPGCSSGDRRIEFKDRDGSIVSGTTIALLSTETTFPGKDVALRGRLVMPAGSEPVPIVVPVHGSEKDSAVLFNFYQRLLPAQGIGVFVYDKRGTGHSTGHYTQDFDVLASDAAAAAVEARRLAGGRVARIGFQGTSQGGWIAPLAATKTAVDFVIVDFGLAGSVAEENRDQVAVELARLGYSGADLEDAAKVADAANEVVASHFRSGYPQLDEVRSRFRAKPWFAKLNGQFTGEILKYPSWVLRLVGPYFDVGTPINYDAMAVLRRVRTPMLWVLAGDDTLAPNASTQLRLKQLAAAGTPVESVIFPGTDHGIQEFTTAPDGSRSETRYADGYFRTTVDFARLGRLPGSYGNAKSLLMTGADPTATALP